MLDFQHKAKTKRKTTMCGVILFEGILFGVDRKHKETTESDLENLFEAFLLASSHAPRPSEIEVGWVCMSHAPAA